MVVKAHAGHHGRLERTRRGASVAAAFILWSLALAACRPEPAIVRESPEPSFILISLDTLRADHLGAYGSPRHTSPALDRLAARSLVFDMAIAQHAATLESHRSLLGSMYPTGQPPDTTLPGVLREHGYQTAAFTGGGFVSKEFESNRGFDTFQTDERLADTLVAARDWLSQPSRASRPCFLFLHTYDIHAPYDPRPPFDSLFTAGYSGNILPERTSDLQRQYMGLDERDEYFESIAWDAADRAYLEALYDGGIREADAQLEELFGFLTDSPSWDWGRDVLVIFGDHGEEFWDHGSIGHGLTVFQEIIRVPLIIRPAGGVERVSRVSRPVELIDVAPTLLDLADIPPPPEFQGSSLAPFITHPVLEPAGGTAISIAPRLLALIRYPWKLIANESGVDLLYNLAEDPDERVSLAGERPDLVEELHSMGKDHQAGRLRKSPYALDAEEVEDPEVRERLRALGYVE